VAADLTTSNTVIVPAQEALSADTRPVNPLPHRWIEANWRHRLRRPRRRHLLADSIHHDDPLMNTLIIACSHYRRLHRTAATASTESGPRSPFSGPTRKRVPGLPRCGNRRWKPPCGRRRHEARCPGPGCARGSPNELTATEASWPPSGLTTRPTDLALTPAGATSPAHGPHPGGRLACRDPFRICAPGRIRASPDRKIRGSSDAPETQEDESPQGTRC